VSHETHFKGWAKPGPISQGLGDSLVVESNETLDAISGHFRLFQLRDGHRFSTDDILTAWYATTWCPTAQTALDLGSGIGTVGMICAWRMPGTRFVSVEAQPESVALARKSAKYNGLADRYDIREGDFREPGVLLADETIRSRHWKSTVLSTRGRCVKANIRSVLLAGLNCAARRGLLRNGSRAPGSGRFLRVCVSG
jgi:hypothetical protein